MLVDAVQLATEAVTPESVQAALGVETSARAFASQIILHASSTVSKLLAKQYCL
jgi:hypothetical protein